MMPCKFHQHDAQFIKAQINKLPQALKTTAIDGYERVYKDAWDSEPIEHKKSNSARRAANTRLREYVEKILSI